MNCHSQVWFVATIVFHNRFTVSKHYRSTCLKGCYLLCCNYNPHVVWKLRQCCYQPLREENISCFCLFWYVFVMLFVLVCTLLYEIFSAPIFTRIPQHKRYCISLVFKKKNLASRKSPAGWAVSSQSSWVSSPQTHWDWGNSSFIIITNHIKSSYGWEVSSPGTPFVFLESNVGQKGVAKPSQSLFKSALTLGWVWLNSDSVSWTVWW